MMEGAERKQTWLYRYEENQLLPVMKTGNDTERMVFDLYNPVDSLYSFCMVEVTEGEGFELLNDYAVRIPGDAENPEMSMYLWDETGSSNICIVVKDADAREVCWERLQYCGQKTDIDMHYDGIGQMEFGSPDEDIIEVDKPELEEAMDLLQKMPGLDGIKNQIKHLVECVQLDQRRKEQGLPSLSFSHHLAFIGNPGTGKTTVARIISRIYAALGVIAEDKLVETDRSGLVDGYVGKTAIKTKKVIDSAKGGVLYIDEAYTLAKDGNDFGQEAIDTLLKEMEDHRDEVVVIVAGYPENMSRFLCSNPGLKSRFKTMIRFEDYTGKELYEIFMLMCRENGMEVEEDAENGLKSYFEKMAGKKDPQFANGRAVRNYFEDVIARQAHRLSRVKKPSARVLSLIKKEDLGIEESGNVRKEVLDELNAMIGLEEVKREINGLLNMMLNRVEREKNGLPAYKGACHMVFTGNPGTRKTTVARILSRILKEIGIIAEDKVVEVDASDMVAGYVGQTALKTRDIIRRAQGGILFIDEAYALERSTGGFGQEAVDTLLKMMEDYRDNLVVIAAGYEKEMGRFICSNPGLKSRFNYYIHFEDYTSEQLYGIFEMLCAGEQYRLDKAAQCTLQEYIYRNYDKFSGNGRDVRNIYEKIKAAQATRLSGGGHTVEELVLITNEDVEEAILRG